MLILPSLFGILFVFPFAQTDDIIYVNPLPQLSDKTKKHKITLKAW